MNDAPLFKVELLPPKQGRSDVIVWLLLSTDGNDGGTYRKVDVGSVAIETPVEVNA
jgi:hypothetical protein